MRCAVADKYMAKIAAITSILVRVVLRAWVLRLAGADVKNSTL